MVSSVFMDAFLGICYRSHTCISRKELDSTFPVVLDIAVQGTFATSQKCVGGIACGCSAESYYTVDVAEQSQAKILQSPYCCRYDPEILSL